jgi:hypothetical protein
MHEINLNYIYHARKTLYLGYKNKSVNAVHFATFFKSILNYFVCLYECHQSEKQQRSDSSGKD